MNRSLAGGNKAAMAVRSIVLLAMLASGCECAPPPAPDSGTDAGPDATVDAGPPCVVCGDECVDTMTDRAHCGGCDAACANGRWCLRGRCGPTLTWARAIAGGNNEGVASLGVGSTGLVVGGSFDVAITLGETVHPSNGRLDVFVAELATASGEVQRSLTFGGDGIEGAAAIGVASDDSLVVVGRWADDLAVPDPRLDLGSGALTHHGGQDIFIAELDPTWSHRWGRAIGGELDDIVLSLALSPTDEIHICGVFHGEADFGGVSASADMGDAFVARYERDGELAWVASGGGDASDVATAVAASRDAVFMAGYFDSSSVDFGSGAVSAGASRSAFLAGYSTSGVPGLSARIGPADERPHGLGISMVADSAGNVVVALGTRLPASLGDAEPATRLLRFGPDGELRSETTLGAACSARHLAIDGEGNLYLHLEAGSPVVDLGGGPLARDSPHILASYTPDGRHRWSLPLPMEGDLQTFALAVGPDGAVYVAGSFHGAVVLDGGTILESHSADGWIIRLDP